MTHGVYGLIDEVWLTPDEFLVIDDKTGRKTFQSNIHQVYGYCLAFKETANDTRRVVAALRERGTNNIYWSASFNQQAEEQIVTIVERVHQLLSGNAEFGSAENPNKCKACRFRQVCDRIAR